MKIDGRAVSDLRSPVQVMITGDYLKTAIAIAKNVQILQPQDDEADVVGKLGIQPRKIFVESPGKTR
jgi:magnesium-transporting ATPase (P-type)